MYCEVVEPGGSKVLQMRLVSYSCLGMLLGLALGGSPIVYGRIIGPQVDPADHGVSYLVWVGGSFMASLGLSYLLPHRRWLGGAAVFSGFFAAFILAITIDVYMGGPQNLWPLGLAFVVLVGAPAAFAGAYVGSKLRR
jgi:hypothetical protein